MAEPCSVPKYQKKTDTSATAMMTPVKIAEGMLREESSRWYLSTLTALFAAMPMMCRLMEYRENWVRMPARIAGMPSLVCSVPVTKPASRPASMATSSAAQAGQPARISMTVTAPPVVKEPSTVRSATSSRRKVI